MEEGRWEEVRRGGEVEEVRNLDGGEELGLKGGRRERRCH